MLRWKLAGSNPGRHETFKNRQTTPRPGGPGLRDARFLIACLRNGAPKVGQNLVSPNGPMVQNSPLPCFLQRISLHPPHRERVFRIGRAPADAVMSNQPMKSTAHSECLDVFAGLGCSEPVPLLGRT